MDSLLNKSRPAVFCPGCAHDKVLHAVDQALTDIGCTGKDVAIVTDIGCSGLFDTFFIAPSATLPVVIGEFGPYSDPWSQMTVDDCRSLIDEADTRSIPWLAWTFHMRCPPNLLVDHSNNGCGIGMSLEPTAEWGRLIQDSLRP